MVIDFSRKEGLVDLPGERKIHTKPVSRIGGVAIWLSTMLTFLCLVFLSYYPYGSLLSGILLGSSLMFLLGLVDDIYNLNAKFKLFIQIAIATLVYLLGVKINSIPFFGGIDLGFWSYPITLLWIVGISNAVNFIDGVDGLAGSVVTVNAITLAIIAVTMSPSSPISALIGFILAGAMLAFLTYNFNPAKIFMGDSGALFSGFLLAAISITGVMKTATIAILLPFVVLAVPIMDITFSSLRRISKGKSPFVVYPDFSRDYCRGACSSPLRAWNHQNLYSRNLYNCSCYVRTEFNKSVDKKISVCYTGKGFNYSVLASVKIFKCKSAILMERKL